MCLNRTALHGRVATQQQCRTAAQAGPARARLRRRKIDKPVSPALNSNRTESSHSATMGGRASFKAHNATTLNRASAVPARASAVMPAVLRCYSGTAKPGVTALISPRNFGAKRQHNSGENKKAAGTADISGTPRQSRVVGRHRREQARPVAGRHSADPRPVLGSLTRSARWSRASCSCVVAHP